MKFRVSYLIALSLLWSMQMAGQTHVKTNTQVIHDSVKIIGPDGAPDGFDAPTALVVLGGRGGNAGVNNANSGNGGGVGLSTGKRGATFPEAGSGGGAFFLKGDAWRKRLYGGWPCWTYN